jgi:hypothetical protein
MPQRCQTYQDSALFHLFEGQMCTYSQRCKHTLCHYWLDTTFAVGLHRFAQLCCSLALAWPESYAVSGVMLQSTLNDLAHEA